MNVLAKAIRNLPEGPRMVDMNMLTKFFFFYRFSCDLSVSLSFFDLFISITLMMAITIFADSHKGLQQMTPLILVHLIWHSQNK
jgi:hypothetical protein